MIYQQRLGLVDFYNASNFFKYVCQGITQDLHLFSSEERDGIIEETEEARRELRLLSQAASRVNKNSFFNEKQLTPH